MDHEKIKEGVRLMLEGIGEDITREGLLHIIYLEMIINNEIPLLSAVMSNRQDIQMSMIKENNLCKFLLSLLSPGNTI